MSDPVVSVIIPVYNSQEYLGQAIDSVIGQRYQGELQIIAVDDGSTDESPAILRSYGGDVEVYTQKNAGSAVARNNGIRRARGDYVAFLDADDVWHPDKTRIQIDHLQDHSHVGIVYASLLFAAPEQYESLKDFLEHPLEVGPVGIVEEASGWVYTKFLKESLLQTSSVIMRRSLIAAVGEFDSRLRKGQDYDYWIRASRETEFHKLVPKLSAYRLSDDGITKKPSSRNYGAIVVESALSRWGRVGPDGSKVSALDIRRRLGELWFDFAYLHEKEGSASMAAAAYLKSLRYEPWRIRRLLKLLVCLGRPRSANHIQ